MVRAASSSWRSKSHLQLVFSLVLHMLEHLWGEVNCLGNQNMFLPGYF